MVFAMKDRAVRLAAGAAPVAIGTAVACAAGGLSILTANRARWLNPALLGHSASCVLDRQTGGYGRDSETRFQRTLHQGVKRDQARGRDKGERKIRIQQNPQRP